MFDTGGVQGVPDPSPRAHTLLADIAAAVVELRRAEARVLAAVAAIERDGVPAETGHRSAARLLQEHVRVDGIEAKTWLRHSSLITETPSPSGATVQPVLPATATALGDGTIGGRHLAVIADVMARVSQVPHLGPPVVAETERQVAGLAGLRSPAQLARDGAEILLRLDPDGQLPDEPERPDQQLHLSTGRDGSLAGKFRFADPEAAETVRTALDALTPPPDPAGTGPIRDLAERRADALHDMAADTLGLARDDDPTSDDTGAELHAVSSDDTPREDAPPDDAPPDDAPPDGASSGEPGGDRSGRAGTRTQNRTQGGDAVHLTVTVPLEVLEARARDRAAWGLLDSQWGLRAETLRRLACDAEIIPAVLGSRGEILNLGRKTRVVSLAQRRAVIARDRHCAHPGCRRRPRRCRIHHLVPWSWHGPTDLDNLVLLCSYHHHLVHHGGWEIHMRHGIPVFIPPAWLDPLRRPQTNDPDAPLAA